MRLLRQPKAPNVAARAVLLLPPAYRQAAMKVLHEGTHVSQQQTIAVPLKSTEATEVWQQFQDNWISTFGVPALLISDRGSQFTSCYWTKQCKIFGIRCSTTPAYHPEANGMVERWHRTLKSSMACDRYSDKNWASRLPIILLGLRARPHLDSGLSPHQLAFGCEITLPADFAIKEAEELDGVDFYEQLKRA